MIDNPRPDSGRILTSHRQAPAQAAPAALQVPKGWSIAVSHSDERVWLTIRTPHGASATLSAAEKTGNGGCTVVAQVLDYLADSLAALTTVAGPWSAGELDGNWLEIDHKDHAGVIRIVWKMEGDARSPVCEARAMAVIDALNAYAAPTTQPVPQQEAQEPVATVIKKGADRQWMSERLGHLPDGIYSLYLAPPSQAAPQPSPASQGATTDEVDVPHQCPYFGPSPHRDVWLAGWYAARAALGSKPCA